MSIFSKVAKGIGGALKGGLGKKILSAIPGVGTAMAIGGEHKEDGRADRHNRC